MNLLLVPGTTLIASEYLEALRPIKNLHLFGAGFDTEHPLCIKYQCFEFLSANLNEAIPVAIRKIVSTHSIDLVIPCHDDWIFALSNVKEELEAFCLTPMPEIAKIIRSKRLTYRKLFNSIPVPKTFPNLESIEDFPVFIKPDRGQGSKDSKIINSLSELNFFTGLSGAIEEPWLVSEYLNGQEFTVDCFSDTQGQLLYCSTRLRIETRNGLAVRTQVLPHVDDSSWAKSILNLLPMVGSWFFQYKLDSNHNRKLLEVAARPAGASGINRLFGVNLPLLNVLQATGIACEIQNYKEAVSTNKLINSEITEAVFHSRIFKNIFVDFDDTLVSWQDPLAPNTQILNFLNVCRLEGKELTLISRHKGDLMARLKQLNIALLFNRIIHIKDFSLKGSLMEKTHEDSLFIDDSFAERKDVKNQLGDSIVTVDPSAFSFQWSRF